MSVAQGVSPGANEPPAASGSSPGGAIYGDMSPLRGSRGDIGRDASPLPQG